MSDEDQDGPGELDESQSYRVGYGKPPKEYQWRPGQSGNRKGKPPAARSFAAEVKRLLKRKVPIKMSGEVRKVTVVEANFERILHKAMGGDTRAMRIIQELAREYLPEEMKAFEDLRGEDRVILARYLAGRAQDPGDPDATA